MVHRAVECVSFHCWDTLEGAVGVTFRADAIYGVSIRAVTALAWRIDNKKGALLLLVLY